MAIFDSSLTKHFPKGTILLRQGEVCNSGYKVIQGCLKSYFVDAAGKEHILQFAPEGWIITDMNSILNGVPSGIFIEAVEDTEVHWIRRDRAGLWLDTSREELLDQVNMLMRNIIASNKRTRLLLSSTGEERYLDFLQTYPTLAQRLPLKLIAAYIGVTPEYLSEIRRKVAGR